MRALATDFSSVAGGLLDLWGKGRGEGYFIMIYKGSGKQGLILHGSAPNQRRQSWCVCGKFPRFCYIFADSRMEQSEWYELAVNRDPTYVQLKLHSIKGWPKGRACVSVCECENAKLPSFAKTVKHIINSPMWCGHHPVWVAVYTHACSHRYDSWTWNNVCRDAKSKRYSYYGRQCENARGLQ